MININKFQAGGGLPPYVAFQPYVSNNVPAANYSNTSSEASTTKKEASEKGKLTDKDLLSMLEHLDGLPSDMEVLYKSISNFYRYEGETTDSATLAQRYISTLRQLKIANFNKKEFDKAYDVINKKDGLNEFAITDSGKIVCMNQEGEIKYLSPEELTKTEGYQALTNSNILSMRMNNIPLDNSLLAVVSNGTSLPEINKLINELKGTLGTNELTNEGYHTSEQSKVMKGIQILEQFAQHGNNGSGMSVSGLYKSKIITKSQAEQAQYALNYIYQMLPANAKALLKIHSNGSDSGAKELIGMNITKGINNEVTFESDLILDENGNKLGSKNKEGSSDELKANTAVQFMQGLGESESFTIMNGTTSGLQVLSNVMPIVGKEGNPLGSGATLAEVTQSQMGPMLDVQNAYMGDEKLQEGALMQVMTDGQIHSIDAPLDLEALSKGEYKPDLDSLKRVEQADNEIRQLNISPKDYDQINKIYNKYRLPVKYSSDGQLRSDVWARFAAFNATALSSALSENAPLSDYLNEIDDEQIENSYLETYKRRNNLNSDKKFKFDQRSWWDNMLGGGQHWYSTHDSFYKGTAFILMRTNVFNALAGSGEKINTGTPNNTQYLESLEQQKQRTANYVNPGSFSNE